MSVQQEQTTGGRPWTDYETMNRLAQRGLSQPEMADELGCSQDTISRWLNRHGIDHDVRSERSGGKRLTARFETRCDGYERWRSWDSEDGNQYVLVHRLLAVAEYGFKVVDGKHVHHRNGVQFDNRPENLELLDPSEHHRGHGRWGRL